MKKDLVITNYKTYSTHGEKIININDVEFWTKTKYLAKKDNGEIMFPYESDSGLGQYINKKSFQQLGEGRIFKSIIKHYFTTHQHDRIRELCRTRGTSVDTVFANYDLYNKPIEDGVEENKE